jgi:hypothetical protein
VTLSEVLSKAFAAAHRRFGLIFVDLLWKAIWLGATIAGLLLVVIWFSSQMQSIAWQDTGVPPLNGLLAARILQEFWEAHRSALFWGFAAVLAVSMAGWFLLEAFFRRRMFRPENSPAKLGGEFRIFLVSGIAKVTMLVAVALVLGLLSFGSYLTAPIPEWPDLWPESRGVAIASCVALLAMFFLLTIFETLIRSDAIVLFGTDLIRVTTLIGILLVFETMIGATVGIAVLAGFLNVSRMSQALVMFGVATVAAVLVSVFHSYLLLVRFSAVSIMRQHVIEI